MTQPCERLRPRSAEVHDICIAGNAGVRRAPTTQCGGCGSSRCEGAHRQRHLQIQLELLPLGQPFRKQQPRSSVTNRTATLLTLLPYNIPTALYAISVSISISISASQLSQEALLRDGSPFQAQLSRDTKSASALLQRSCLRSYGDIHAHLLLM